MTSGRKAIYGVGGVLLVAYLATANMPSSDEPAAAVPVAAPPSLTLMGIAEETSPQGVRRTAVIGGEGDTLYMVLEGQAVGDRYKVTKIGADAIELEDLITHGYRRLAIR